MTAFDLEEQQHYSELSDDGADPPNFKADPTGYAHLCVGFLQKYSNFKNQLNRFTHCPPTTKVA